MRAKGQYLELLRNTIFGLNLTWRELRSTRNSVNPRRPEYHPSFLERRCGCRVEATRCYNCKYARVLEGISIGRKFFLMMLLSKAPAQTFLGSNSVGWQLNIGGEERGEQR